MLAPCSGDSRVRPRGSGGRSGRHRLCEAGSARSRRRPLSWLGLRLLQGAGWGGVAARRALVASFALAVTVNRSLGRSRGRAGARGGSAGDHKVQSLDARDRGIAVWDLHRTFLRERLDGRVRWERCGRWFPVRRASAARLRPAGRVVGVCRGSEGSASIHSRSKVLSDGERPLRGLRLRLHRQADQISQVRRGESGVPDRHRLRAWSHRSQVNSGITAAVPVATDHARGERSPGSSEAVSDRAAPNDNRPPLPAFSVRRFAGHQRRAAGSPSWRVLQRFTSAYGTYGSEERRIRRTPRAEGRPRRCWGPGWLDASVAGSMPAIRRPPTSGSLNLESLISVARGSVRRGW